MVHAWVGQNGFSRIVPPAGPGLSNAMVGEVARGLSLLTSEVFRGTTTLGVSIGPVL